MGIARQSRGFTLIELMIVVAIIAILAATALPQFQIYTVKSKLTEAVTDLDAAKAAVTDVFQAGNASFPATASPPIPTGTTGAGGGSVLLNAKYVASIAYNSTATSAGSIVVTLGNTGSSVDGKYIGVFGAGNGDGTITWTCGTATAATSTSAGAVTAMYPYLPSTCRN